MTKKNIKGMRDNRWYLNIMSPNTKGEKFAWLDPTSIYINTNAFIDLLDDLLDDLEEIDCDVVAGIDAMGFVLGSALAARLRKGFLPIRKAGKLCVDTKKVDFVNYSKRNQFMEIRFPAFEAGTKVIIVDQWVETGGTMGAAIKLIEQQGGLVKGVIALAIEENDNTKKLRNDYKCFSAVVPGSEWQKQCNEQYLQSFKSYEPNMAFPKKK
ncbi:MAG: adenine phosphoribosyltransferase [Rhodobacterales bacterium]|jgi:adenine phosphoribosyltransferase|nr:MAG: adenine phosphoribosyltransferase [Rhodobacterales bacterium]|tara:strand:+ start:367 stop:999 length:633 start_codon:yes stop_codon:yes gene_type:complete